MNNNVQLP